MRQLFRYLRDRRFKYEPLAEITLSRKNLLHNLELIRKYADKLSISPVLKSNAYGHGLVQIAKILENCKIERGAAPLIVDSYYEALTLRNEGIRAPILIIGYTLPANIYASRLSNVAFTLHDSVQIREISSQLSSKRTFHLKIDTGMHRQGIPEKEVKEAIELVKKNKNIIIEGVCSHLGDADNDDQTLTERQIKSWNWVAGFMRLTFPKIKWFHLGASESLPYASKIDANMMRVGISMYGIRTKATAGMDLRPVLALQSIISGIKTILAGENVGYGATFKTSAESVLATIPVGYFEGVDLRLSNKGFLKIGDSFVPIAGRVSMNITSIDITAIPGVKIGEQVIVISSNRDDKNSVENISKICGTIPYEILVHLPTGIRRTIIG